MTRNEPLNATSTRQSEVMLSETGIGSMSATAGALDIISRGRGRSIEHAHWEGARQRLGMFAHLRQGWDGANSVAPSSHAIQFAAQELAELCAKGIEAPIINPSADGAIYAHWHRAGLDIELIFEGPYEVILLVDDVRGEVPSFADEDPELKRAHEALHALAKR